MTSNIESLNIPEAKAAATLAESAIIEEQKPVLTEVRTNELLARATGLLHMYDDFIKSLPLKGRDYFALPNLPQSIEDAHREFSEEDTIDTTNMLINTPFINEALQTHHPKAVGMFLRGVMTVNKEAADKGLSQTPIEIEDESFEDQLTNVLILQIANYPSLYPAIRPHAFSLVKDSEQIEESEKEEKRRLYDLVSKVEGRAGMKLFGMGYYTGTTRELFNHMNQRAFLHEFGEEQIVALQAAFSDPEYLDPYGVGEKNSHALAGIGLIAASKKAGAPIDASVVSQMEERHGEWFNSRLKYIFATDPKTSNIDPYIEELLARPLNKNQSESILYLALTNGTSIHPDSYAAETIKESGLPLEQVFTLTKVALDATNGNIERLNPVIHELLQGSSEGELSKKAISSLVYACIGFDVDIPNFLQPSIKQHYSQVAEGILTDKPRRTYTKNDDTLDYPVHPIYRLFSEGLQALPKSIADVFSQDEINRDEIATQIMTHLFKDGFYTHYFDPILSQEYPTATLSINELDGKLWQLVHPDIWNLLREADTVTLLNVIKDVLPGGMVQLIKYPKGTEIYGTSNVSIDACLPPDLFEAIAKLHIETATENDNISWADNVVFEKGLPNGKSKETPKPYTQLMDFSQRIWRHIQSDLISKNISKSIFNRLWKLPNESGIGLEIFDPELKDWIVIPGKSHIDQEGYPDDIKLVIANPVSYLEKYLAFLGNIRYKYSGWYQSIDAFNIWRNATPWDFLHPEQYLDHQTFQSNDKTFHHLEHWTEILQARELGETLKVRYSEEGGFTESQHDLLFTLSALEDPTDTDQLPSVRYGLIDQNTAVVYAIQMPLIDRMAPSNVKVALERQNNFLKYYTNFAKAAVDHDEFFTSIAGDISEVILHPPEDLDFNEYVRHISAKILKNNGVKSYTELQRKYQPYLKQPNKSEDIGKSYVANIILNLVYGIEMFDKASSISPLFEERSERMKRVNVLFANERKNGNSQSRNIPSGPALSLALFCILAKTHGVTRIQVPTYFPRRLHDDPETDQRILQQMTKTIESVTNLIDGVSISSFPDDSDGSFYLGIEGELSSTNETLSNAIKNISAVSHDRGSN